MSNPKPKLKLNASDYDVGYQKPPKATQFSKGQSGNPNGRPKGGMSLKSIVRRAFAAKVIVNEGGKRQSKSKIEVSLTQLANKAASGDLKATNLMLQLSPMMEEESKSSVLTPDLIADRELAQKIVARMAKVALQKPPENDNE
jgi:hypothetical protein